jgi:hypothetical protein
MPRARKERPHLDPNTVYIAWQSFAIDIDGMPVDVKQGTRLRGDHPTVVASHWNWIADGAGPPSWPSSAGRFTLSCHRTLIRMSERSRRRRLPTATRWFAFRSFRAGLPSAAALPLVTSCPRITPR